MANERRIRLIQVAKEFNVGINTITDFLQKKGVKSDGSPNALVDAETYALLEKEFGAGRAVNSERVNIRERIAQKQATVTLDDDAKGKGGKNDEELLVKSNVISVKDEVAAMSTPKILGKIDLSGKKPAAAMSFAVNDTVDHKVFGRGTVVKVDGDTLHVKFARNNQTKKLLKDYAPIVKIS